MINPDIDRENLEISFSCASNYPYARRDRETNRYFIEKLVISPDSVDLTRLNGGASVLKNHDTDIVLGKVVRAWIEGEALCVRIRFRSDGMSRSLFDDLAAGTIPNVSIGYSVEHYAEHTDAEGNLVRDVDRWTAYEVSVAVGVPADPTVGFYRSFDFTENQHINNTTKKEGITPMATRADEETKKPAEETESEAEKKPAEEEKACGEKKACGDKKKSCGEDEEKPEMRAMIEALKREVDTMKGETRSLVVPNISTSGKRSYNMTNVLTALVGRKADIGFERELSDELYRSCGQVPGGDNAIMIPFNGDSMRGVLATREMNDSAASGAGLVAQQNMPNLFVDFVRSRIGVKNATFLTGLTGAPVTIPAQTTDTSVAWVSGGTTTTDANAAVSETTPVIGDVTLTPHKLGGFTVVGKDMILMANPDATAIVMRSLLANVAHVLGTTMLKGNASNPAITGVATATGVQTQVIANIASATWANFTAMIGKIEGLEWDGPQEFVMSASDNALLKSIAKGNYGSGFIVEDGYLDGRRVHVDGSLSSGDIFLGDWSNVIVGQWGGIELMVDPYTLATAGSVRVIVSLVCDIGILRPNTFVMRTAS